VLIPLQCEYLALEGLTQLISAIRLVQDHLNSSLRIEGVLLTMFDVRLNSPSKSWMKLASSSRQGLQDSHSAQRAAR
jgi:cellulose biosynthesis protein BcsQ